MMKSWNDQTFQDAMIRSIHASSEPLEKPGLGVGPVALDRAFGEPKNLGGFGLAESDKKPQLDDFGLGAVGFFEFIESFVECQNRFLLEWRGYFDVVNVQPLLAAAVSDRKPLARPINQDVTHGLGSGSEEVPASLPLFSAGPHQLQPRLVDQSSCLQGLPWGLLRHFVGSEFAQLLIDQWQQVVGSFGIALLSSLENARDIGHTL